MSNSSNHRQKYLKAVRQAYQDEKLVMVLGAGLSINHGVPSWKVLLRHMLVASIEASEENGLDSDLLAQLFTRFFGLSPLAAGRYLQAYYSNRQPEEPFAFEKALRATLYQNILASPDQRLMNEVVNFCAAPGKSPNLDSVITYNYDELLEKALSSLDVSVPHKAIFDAGMNPDRGELPIYHVHGFLPLEGELSEKNRVAFGENIYHHQYNEIYSWRNIVQINKFRDYSCLFVGISLTDPNLRRLLDIAKLQKGTPEDYHHIFRKRYDKSDIVNRINMLSAEDWWQEQPSEITGAPEAVSEELVKIVERYEEKDALSFGVRTIWVDDFDEIPKFLEMIRTGR